MSVLVAERIKLTSTRSPWWCSVIIVVLGLGIAIVMGVLGRNGVTSPDPKDVFILTPDNAVAGVSGFGVLVVMIMAALAVTTEYRFGVIRTTFQAVPNRTAVLAAKAAVVAVVSGVLIAIVTFGAYYLAKVIAGTGPFIQMELADAAAWRALYGLILYAVLASILAVAVGALLRQSAGAIALLVLWPLVIEPLFTLFGSVGKSIYVFLPFANVQHFVAVRATTEHFHWGAWGGLAYFAVFVAIVVAVSVVVVNKRDA